MTMIVIKQAQDEVLELVARWRPETAVTSNVTGAMDSDAKTGDEVSKYRENPSEIWTEPFLVGVFDGKILTI